MLFFCATKKYAKSRQKALHDFSLHLYMKLRFVTTFLGDIEMVTNILQWLKKQDNEKRENNYISFQRGDIFVYFHLRRFIFDSFSFFRLAEASVAFLHLHPSSIALCRSCCFYINMTYHTMLSHYWSMLSRQMCIDSVLSLASHSSPQSRSIDRSKEPRNR